MKIEPKLIVEFFKEKEVEMITGVPDSVLSGLIDAVDSEFAGSQHIVAANEGNAAAIAIGHYLGSGKPAIVYLQNSGLGNLVNPIVSLANKRIYEIPTMLIIGWRGEPGKKDEPQHLFQGLITEELLELLEIPTFIIDEATKCRDLLEAAWHEMTVTGQVSAVVFKHDAFAKKVQASNSISSHHRFALNRETATEALFDLISDEYSVIATTGKCGREVFEIRERRSEANTDFLTVGGMGHASSIALGVCVSKPNEKVLCIDGDGALLMHLGALAIVGAVGPKNFTHVLMNNHCHESVGGHKTMICDIELGLMVKGAGYASYNRVTSTEQLKEIWPELQSRDGPHFIEIKINSFSRQDLGRPKDTPIENRDKFMQKINPSHRKNRVLTWT